MWAETSQYRRQPANESFRIARNRSAQPEQRQHRENDDDKADEINDAVH
jgi:hypothetical protein